MLRLAGTFLAAQCCLFSIAWSQDVAAARLEVTYLKDAAEYRKSIKSAHGIKLKSTEIPVGSQILHGGLKVRGKPVYRVFDGNDLVKAE